VGGRSGVRIPLLADVLECAPSLRLHNLAFKIASELQHVADSRQCVKELSSAGHLE